MILLCSSLTCFIMFSVICGWLYGSNAAPPLVGPQREAIMHRKHVIATLARRFQNVAKLTGALALPSPVAP
jgi:hypothetical protein